jgi:hypothetical protein
MILTKTSLNDIIKENKRGSLNGIWITSWKRCWTIISLVCN